MIVDRNPRKSSKSVAVLATSLAVLACSVTFAEEGAWPREIESKAGTVVIYQPQPDSFEGNIIKARAAVSVTLKDQTDPRFGAVWLTARVSTDRDDRTAVIEDVKIDGVRFPEATEEHAAKLTAFLEQEIPKWDLTISLDRLLTSLEISDSVQSEAEQLNNDPPKIFFVDHPAVLITIDGAPELRAVEDANYMRVINTPFMIVLDTVSTRYYLDGGEIWYIAADVMGPWQKIDDPPAGIVALRPEAPPDSQPPPDDPSEEEEPRDTRIPEIVIATEPTELIVSDGEPKYTPLSGTDLLYLSNSESDVLMEIASQRYFVILSGRWYAGKPVDGPWSYVPADELPASLGKIPPESDMGHLLVWVPGTDEAKDAVMDNQIPQTAAIKRSEAHLTVTYDGKPQFEKIEGTSMKYAANTATSVIQVGKKYYACDNAVWFVADDALGPWIVADEIPKEIYTIPASSPVYNVKYVYIYDSTPDVVYVGYYPGYTGSYVYQGTVVYGTGYYYPAWTGTYYYARPSTWGFSVRWNPWWGWSFGLSYSNGPFTFHIGFGRGGWWGPRGWRGYRRGYHRGWHHGYRAGARAGYRAGQRSAHRSNMYNRPENKARNADRPNRANRPAAQPAPGRDNNVLTDRNGDVYRKTDDGWQKREGNDWKNSDVAGDRSRPAAGEGRPESRPEGATRPSTGGGGRPDAGTRPSTGGSTGDLSRPSTGAGSSDRSRPSTGGSSFERSGSSKSGGQQLNRDYNNRQRGSSRTQNYQRSSGGSRGRSGGGRGRR
jgi:hypothetical protein